MTEVAQMIESQSVEYESQGGPQDVVSDSEETCALFVGNIAYEIEEDNLRDLFSQYVTVQDVRIVASEHKRFAFVDIIGRENADKVIEALHNFELAGRQLVVKVSVPREEGQQSPKRNFSKFEGGNFYAGRGQLQYGNNNYNYSFPTQNGWGNMVQQQRGYNNYFLNQWTGQQVNAGRPRFGPGSDNYRTRACRHFSQGSACPFGDRCTYSHDPNLCANFKLGQNNNSNHKVENRSVNYQTKPCRHFAQGSCTFGERCKYIHDTGSYLNSPPPIYNNGGGDQHTPEMDNESHASQFLQ